MMHSWHSILGIFSCDGCANHAYLGGLTPAARLRNNPDAVKKIMVIEQVTAESNYLSCPLL